MPVLFGFAIAFFIFFLLAALVVPFAEEKAGPALAAVVFLLLGLGFTVGSSMNMVPAKNVGVVQSFGKPTGEVTGPGLKWVAPWKKVIDWDASVQTSNHLDPKNCVKIRIGNMTMACVQTQVTYEVVDQSAPAQVITYKGDFENMKNNYFEPRYQDALQAAFADYDPINLIDSTTGLYKFDPTVQAKEVETILNQRIGKDVLIKSVMVTVVNHDEKTEASMAKYQEVIADNRRLVQEGKNALQEKANANALKDLPQSYLDNKCLEIAKDLNKEPGLCGGSNVQNVRPIS